jgi:hypothetical protein
MVIVGWVKNVWVELLNLIGLNYTECQKKRGDDEKKV